MRSPALPPVAAVLEAGLAEGVAPAIAAEVRSAGARVHVSLHGRRGQVPLGPEDLFDVASLTKPMAVGTLAARLHADGSLDLDAPAARWLPGFGGDKAGITFRHLLAHASGLPAWRPLHRVADGHSGLAGMAVEAALAAEPLESAPGARSIYSDLGFIALGMALERAHGAPLDVLCEERVFRPLGLERAFYLPDRVPSSAEVRRRAHAFVPTTVRETGEVRVGVVHDENARALGGVAGHAGLFASVAEVAALGQAWLDAHAGRSTFLPAETARLFAARAEVPGGNRALAWDLPAAEGSALGDRLGRGPQGAIGHLGFTGCSLWIDLDRALVCALLTNHCPRRGEGQRIRELRSAFHDAVAAAIG